MYRNRTSTLTHSVPLLGPGGQLKGSGAGGRSGSAWSGLSVRSWEVARYPALQDDLLNRYGIAMQPNDRHDLRLMSPAIAHVGGGRFLLFFRVSCYPAELYDNLLWVEEADESLTPIPGSGAVIGVPTHSAALMAPGPEDPRVMLMGGQPLVFFNHQFRNNDRRMLLYNHASRNFTLLHAAGLTFQRAEKNWMPFEHEGALHLVYQMTPLIVLRCSMDGACVCVVPAGGCAGVTGISKGVVSRGGTPLTPVAPGLFFGLLHSTYRAHTIRAHAAFLSTRPWGWVSVSGSLPIPEGLPGCYEPQVPWDVQFPSSALLLGPRGDSLLLGLHVRDAMSALVQMDLGVGMPDMLAALLEQACEEALPEGSGGAKAGSGSADPAFVLSPVDGRPWLQADGGKVRTCAKWRVIGDGELDGRLVPLLAT